jgi:predicted nucleotidyltransferase
MKPSVSDFLHRVTDWAASQPAISGVALVGSYARSDATADSDIDLVLLCTEPGGFLIDTSWLHLFGAVERYQAEDWGLVQSLRVYYRESFEVEFGITSRMWAALPIDPGTQQVVAHGIRLLMDREGLLGRLLETVTAS